MTASWEPACMDGPDLIDYRAGVIRGCADCTTDYANDRRAEGRCNGVPGELLAGVVPAEEEPMPEPVTLAGKRHPVTVIAPCGTCAHAAVCRIRPTVEGVRSLTVIAPDTDEAVTFTVSASVSCDHYAKAKAAKPTETTYDVGGQPVGQPRKLNLSDEERERRRQRAIAMSAENRERAAAS